LLDHLRGLGFHLTHDLASPLQLAHLQIVLPDFGALAGGLGRPPDDRLRRLQVHVVAVSVPVADRPGRPIAARFVHLPIPQHAVTARLVAPCELVKARAKVRHIGLVAGDRIHVDREPAMRGITHAGVIAVHPAELLIFLDAEPLAKQLAPSNANRLLAAPEAAHAVAMLALRLARGVGFPVALLLDQPQPATIFLSRNVVIGPLIVQTPKRFPVAVRRRRDGIEGCFHLPLINGHFGQTDLARGRGNIGLNARVLLAELREPLLRLPDTRFGSSCCPLLR
jgi:hypothetical protein